MRYLHSILAAFLLSSCLLAPGIHAQPRIIGGKEFCVALCEDGSVATWGRNNHYQLGMGGTSRNEGPAHDPILTDVVDVWCGAEIAIAKKRDGSLWAWGHPEHASFLLDTFSTYLWQTPRRMTDIRDVRQVVIGLDRSNIVHTNGRVSVIYAPNEIFQYGVLGTGDTTLRPLTCDTVLVDSVLWVGTCGLTTFALQYNGTVLGWGNNSSGLLCRPDSINMVETPQPLPGLPRMKSVVTGKSDVYSQSLVVLALDSVGHVWTWGWNNRGQLGDGSMDRYRWQPKAIPGIDSVVEIAAGEEFAAALRADGTVWVWGKTALGRDGYSQWDTSHVPVQCIGFNDIDHISCGWYSLFAHRRDGAFVGWGDNYYGQLNNGTLVETVPFTQMRPFCGGSILHVPDEDLQEMAIIPNPASTEIEFDHLPDADVLLIQIYDSIGQCVQQIPGFAGQRINVSGLAVGMYRVEAVMVGGDIHDHMLQVVR